MFIANKWFYKSSYSNDCNNLMSQFIDLPYCFPRFILIRNLHHENTISTPLPSPAFYRMQRQFFVQKGLQ